MLAKVMILIGVMHFYINSGKAMSSALLWGGALFLSGLLIVGFNAAVFFGSMISFVLALGVFTLLNYLDGNALYWPVFFFSIALLMLI